MSETPHVAPDSSPEGEPFLPFSDWNPDLSQPVHLEVELQPTVEDLKTRERVLGAKIATMIDIIHRQGGDPNEDPDVNFLWGQLSEVQNQAGHLPD